MVEIQKTIIRVDRKTQPFKCRVCKKMVGVNYAKPKITETENAILYGWDYKHVHKNIFHIQKVEGQPMYFPLNDTNEE